MLVSGPRKTLDEVLRKDLKAKDLTDKLHITVLLGEVPLGDSG